MGCRIVKHKITKAKQNLKMTKLSCLACRKWDIAKLFRVQKMRQPLLYRILAMENLSVTCTLLFHIPHHNIGLIINIPICKLYNKYIHQTQHKIHQWSTFTYMYLPICSRHTKIFIDTHILNITPKPKT